MRLSCGFGLFGVIATSALPASPVWADPPDQPAEPPAGDRKPVLGGPKVAETKGRKTLIARDFDGRIKRLDIPPEEAALALVEIDAPTRAKIDSILAQRAAALDAFVAENLFAIADAYNAAQAGDKAAARKIYAELTQKAAPLRERGKLSEEIMAALPEETAAEYDRFRREYWDAILREDVATGQVDLEEHPASPGGAPAGAPPVKGSMSGALRREFVHAVGAEIKRSYERLAAARAGELKQFVDALSLSPEQETKVKNILTDDFQKTQGKRTAVQSVALLQAIGAQLTPEQRTQLGQYLRERRGK